MPKWFTTMTVAAALACPVALARAQQLPAAPKAGAPQPANNNDDNANDNDAEVRDGDQQIRAGEMDQRRQLEVELHNLAQGQRALALARVQAGDAVGALGGANGMAQFRLRGKTEKAAWLGVSTSKLPLALRKQIKLKNKYAGLIVERVEPNSPADEAGIQQFDIIEKVGDQWIINTEQFSAVLRMNEPGKEVAISVIREGQPQEVKAKLAEKELPVLGANGEWEAVAGPVAGPFQWAPGAQGDIFVQPDRLEPMILERFGAAENSTTTIKDDEHTLKITTKKGKRNLVASDANGVVLYDGPINTEEERANVPEEIRAKVDKQLEAVAARNKVRATKKTPATAPANEKE